MKTGLCAGLAMAAGLGAATAATAQDDDWEFQEDPARNISVAAARYDAGQMIVVQCRDNKLTAVLTGLPQSAEALQLQATRADGRRVAQGWLPAGAPGAYRAASPGRDVRFLRGGGLYSIQTAEGATTAFRGVFDLPTQFANLDRVLTACGWAASDDRDLLADAQVSLSNPEDAGRRRRVPTQRGATSRAPRREIPLEALPRTQPDAETGVSCIVRDLHLRECRAVHPASAQNRDVLAVIEANEGEQVYPTGGSDAAANEGKVLQLFGGRLIVVDYIATIPG